jgi:hypothetical protein
VWQPGKEIVMAIPQTISDNPTIKLRFAKRSELGADKNFKSNLNMKIQETVVITSSLLRATIAQLPWIDGYWQDKAKSLFDHFDDDGEKSIEAAIVDSEIPQVECGKMMQGCAVYGFFAIKDAIQAGLDARPMETVERDDIGEYKATLEF